MTTNDLVSLTGILDLTSLSGFESEQDIEALCQKGIAPAEGLPSVAAICVYPLRVSTVAKVTHGTGVRACAVSGGFPHAMSPLSAQLIETQSVLDDGALEVDIVIPKWAAHQGDWQTVQKHVTAHKSVCGDALLKVILETGEMGSDSTGTEMIASACKAAIAGGADFLKTSTGKVAISATVEAVEVMMKVVAEHYHKTGQTVGIKVAGGVRTVEQALPYIALAEAHLPFDWRHPQHMRFGASSLLDDIVTQWEAS
jgi:deoxyribose-phosphate aldolase